jgi:flagellar basal-body rod protein FlgC
MINLLTGISNTTSALAAERLRMDVVSQNIANANTTRDINGKPYQRQQVVFETLLNQQQTPDGSINAEGALRVARVETDHRPVRLVFNPAHPDADETGLVAMPNINIHEEMADLMVSSRAYEANLAVVRTARTMALQTLAIGKR